MARLEVFQSNHMHSPDERKSLRIRQIKLEYTDQIEKLNTSVKPEPLALMRSLLKASQQRKSKRMKEKTEKAAKKIIIKPRLPRPNKRPTNNIVINSDKRVKEKAAKKIIANPRLPRTNKRPINNLVINSDEAFKLPTPDGFIRIVVQRQRGSSAGRLDTYYLGPNGEKLRSRPDIARYLERLGISNLTVNHFEFICTAPKFEVLLSQPLALIPEKGPVSAPVKLKVLSVHLENIDHLLQKLPAGTVAHETEEPPEESQAELSDSDVAPTPELEDELDLDELNWQSVKIPCRWQPYQSPYKLIYEDFEINGNCWKLFTASIIIYYWKLNSFVHRFFQLFKNENMVLEMSQEAILPAMQSGMSCPKFIKTFSIIRAFTEEYVEKKWRHPVELTGILQYSLDVVNIFYLGNWLHCQPTTHDLTMYLQWVRQMKSAGALL